MSKTTADLIDSICKSDIQGVLSCLNDGVDVNECDDKGFSPLMRASDITFYIGNLQARFEIVELLILRGAEIDKKNSAGWSPLLFAVDGDFHPAINILIRNNADVNIQANDKETTPLQVAVDLGFPGAVKLLLTHKADPTSIRLLKNSAGFTLYTTEEIRELLEGAKKEPVSRLRM